MKLSRLIQPRNPQFWVLIALNGLSTAISWILRTRDLPAAVTVVLAGFAVCNVLLGLWIAFRLMNDDVAGG
jgi:redox-regulated HSP33 family molecular chaperone